MSLPTLHFGVFSLLLSFLPSFLLFLHFSFILSFQLVLGRGYFYLLDWIVQKEKSKMDLEPCISGSFMLMMCGINLKLILDTDYEIMYSYDHSFEPRDTFLS